jgi:glutathione synthase
MLVFQNFYLSKVKIMKHIFFIDKLEKLNPKKDTSLMMAASFKERGEKVFLIFEDDFYIDNKNVSNFKLYTFDHSFYKDSFYLEKFLILNAENLELHKNDVIHMRIDPPFDTRYLKFLWMLKFLEDQGIKITNSPVGILKYNEKLYAYAQESSLPTFIGSSIESLKLFLNKNSDVEDFILKPLDLFQGIGVEKIKKSDAHFFNRFLEKVKENNGAIIVQKFNPSIYHGEIRALFYKGKELGSILKKPKDGVYLANIAQGASFDKIELSSHLMNECRLICKELDRDGVEFVAFDIMGESISEINITCPGLLVEVSIAHKKNLAYCFLE